MGKKHIVSTHNRHVFRVAKLLVSFQKRPGAFKDRIIRDGGCGIFYREGEQPITINPVDGIYAIPLGIGERGYFEIFDTVFTVASLESGKDNDISLKRPAIVNWSLPLSPVETLVGVQQRLQILGYYTGAVDGKMGRLTERAVLEFQADEGNLLIDGVPGPRTQAALESYFSNNGIESTSQLPIIRRYLVSFTRFATGHARWDSPHPDIRGGDNPVVSYFIPKGIVSWLLDFLNIKESEQQFKIKMERENFAPRSKNTYVTLRGGDERILSIEERSVESTPKEIPPIVCVTKEVGDAKILVRFGAKDGPVIGELDVKIVSLLQVNIFLHILDIQDNQGNQVPNKWTIQKAKELIRDINAIWAPTGIEFKVVGEKEYRVIGKYAGTITDVIDERTQKYKKIEFYPLWKKNNIEGKINVYFANELLREYTDDNGNIIKVNNNIMGYALSRRRVGSGGLVGVCIKYDDDTKNLARTVAHELGHILGLTSHPHSHSDDDGDDTPYRHDIWSRSRLMGKYIGYYDNDPDRHWQDTGYGKNGNLMNAGCLITIKKLKNDNTDDELNIARNAADRGPY